MKELSDGRRVLQPTSIDKISREERFASDNDEVRSVYGKSWVEPLIPSLLLRMAGYTRDPEDCTHGKTKFTESAMRWRCADCGIYL